MEYTVCVAVGGMKWARQNRKKLPETRKVQLATDLPIRAIQEHTRNCSRVGLEEALATDSY